MKTVVAVACAAAAVVGTAPASGAAITYWYRPSHPMNHSPKPVASSDCTGGWGVRANSGNTPYFLTAGHCFSGGQAVYGTSGQFGTVAATNYPSGLDTAIVSPGPEVDGLQEIPGLGRVVGKMSNEWSTTGGNGIAMQGTHSGRTYGTIRGGWYSGDNGKRMACGSYTSTGGDSGSPVFVHNSNGVYAAGVHLGKLPLSDGSLIPCFVTIDDLLAHWGVWLPVFSSAAKTGAVPDGRLQPDLTGPAESLPINQAGTLILE